MATNLESVTNTIIQTFADFNIAMEVTSSHEGFNHYHIYLTPTQPVRMHEIRGFVDDLRFALGTYVVSIEAPVQNKKEIAIKVLKTPRGQTVEWQDLHTHVQSLRDLTPLTVPLGMTGLDTVRTADIAELQHLLIGGRTCTGKSTLVHSIINSLILRHNPDVVRFILVDPSGENLQQYKGIPHLITDPITSAPRTVTALKWACKELERRYEILTQKNVLDIAEYHRTVSAAELKKEPLPYIVVIIDEMADVMSEYGDQAEKLLCRLVMMASAIGIHVVLTTASSEPRIVRPMLRANIFSLVCFTTDSAEDSQVLLGDAGAEEVFGRGAALYSSLDIHPPTELQTALITNQEIQNHILEVKRRLGVVDENNADLITLTDYSLTAFTYEEDDELYDEAKRLVLDAGKASTAFLQRKLRIGYSRAARLLDLLEDRGVIGPADGSQPREILE